MATRAKCAQRLSASLFVPPHRAALVAQRPVACSTPFGIIVRSTLQFLFCCSDVNMCSTPFGIIVRSTGDGRIGGYRYLRVLNAFRHHCSFHLSDQRLHFFLCLVLNAFRHHCSFHGRRLPAVARVIDVLNAFRHHCSFHGASRNPDDLLQSVLNAFRHHCSFHRGLDPLITSPKSGAQRLSASLFVPRHHAEELMREESVLNAFRHHCSFHCRWPRVDLHP